MKSDKGFENSRPRPATPGTDLSGKDPDEDFEKTRQGNLSSENSNYSSQDKYEKLLEQKQKQIDNLLEKITTMKDQHPYDDYESFETRVDPPTYFQNPVKFSPFMLCNSGLLIRSSPSWIVEF